MDWGSGARRRETPPLPVQRGCRTRWTPGTVVDDGRLTHNPEVAGSNPAPATSFRRSRPSPSRERAFSVPGAVAKPVAAPGLRAAWQRDGRDGVTRDETAWTWWTSLPATSGCLAQKYRRRTGVRAGPLERALTPERYLAALVRTETVANTARALSRSYRIFCSLMAMAGAVLRAQIIHSGAGQGRRASPAGLLSRPGMPMRSPGPGCGCLVLPLAYRPARSCMLLPRAIR
jgi:hypothetical protein